MKGKIMGYGDESSLTVSTQEPVNPDAKPGEQKRTEYMFSSAHAVPFGIMLRMLNAHKIPYIIAGTVIIVPEPVAKP